MISKIKPTFSKEETKQLLEMIVEFNTFADRINAGEIIITDKNYYNNQADFCENKTL